MRVAWHDDAELVLGELEERTAQVEHLVCKARGELLGVMACIGRDLVIAAPARMQASTCCTDGLGQAALDGHVNILVIDIELEIAFVNLGCNGIESRANARGVFLRDHALTGEHKRMRLRPLDIGLPHALVDGQRRTEGLRELRGRILEATSPERLTRVHAVWGRCCVLHGVLQVGLLRPN